MDEICNIIRDHSNDVLIETPNEDPCYFMSVNISRFYAWEDFLEYLEEDTTYEYKKKLKVHFISNFGEHEDLEIALDEGGPTREFFRLVQESLVLTSGLFEGPDTLKVFSAKVSAVRNRKFFNAGYAVGAAIAMGGQSFCCLAPSIVDYIIYGQQRKNKPAITEIADYDIRNALQEVRESTTTEQLRNLLDEKLDERFQLGVDTPTCFVTLETKQQLIDDICLSYIIHRSTAAIHQFMDGLQVLGILSLMRRHPSLRCLLEYSDRFAIDAVILKDVLKFQFSPAGSNRIRPEERLAKRLLDYIDDISRSPRCLDDHQINLHSILSFATGLSRLPPTGLASVRVDFDHTAVEGALPSANTCGCALVLPVYSEMAQKLMFNEKMDKAILYAGGMQTL